jgi:hypothetical protein
MEHVIDHGHVSRVPDPETATLNLFVRAWGHQFLYDPASLHGALTAAGFTDVKDVKLDASDDPQLRGLEKHWSLDDEGPELDEAAAQYVEATAPDRRR